MFIRVAVKFVKTLNNPNKPAKKDTCFGIEVASFQLLQEESRGYI